MSKKATEEDTGAEVIQETAEAETGSKYIDVEKLREQLRAEIRAEILAEEKAKGGKAEAQAERKARQTMAEAKKDLVELELFQDDDKYKDDLFVAVNGERYQIKRGVRVKVPRFVADAVEQSVAQDKKTANLIRRYELDYKKAVDSNNL